MKKAINIIVIIVIVFCFFYFLSNMILSSQINKQMNSLKQSGYATTISEIKPVSTQESKKAAELITTAYQEITKGNEDEQNLRNRNIAIADSINFEDNPQLFNNIINENKTTINLLLEATKYPQVDFEFQYQDGYNAKMPQQIISLTKFTRLLRIYAKTLFAKGETEKAFNVLRQTIKLANFLQDNTILFHLIKTVNVNNTLDLIQHNAGNGSIASLESLASSIEKIDPRSSLTQGIQNEIIIGTNAFNNDKNFANNVLANLDPITFQRRVFCLLLKFSPFRKYEELKFIKSMGNTLELVKSPCFESRNKWQKLDKRFHKRMDMFIPNPTILNQRTENLESKRTITYLGLKTITYKKTFGHLPDTPTEIVLFNSDIPVPNTLKKIPFNFPIDPYSGKPYIYKKLADGFIIYGVGIDGKDDNGNPETDIIWSVKI